MTNREPWRVSTKTSLLAVTGPCDANHMSFPPFDFIDTNYWRVDSFRIIQATVGPGCIV